MAKRRLTRQQSWRIQKVQQEREARAAKREQKAEETLDDNQLGGEQHGLVVAHYGTQVAIESYNPEAPETSKGEPAKRCHLRANLGSLVTGDRVIWRDGDPIGVVVAKQERDSELLRPDNFSNLKPVAANINRIVIVVAPYPELHPNLIDRYMVAAETQGITPILLINKSDRIDDSNRERVEGVIQRYRDIGYEVHRVSTLDEDDMCRLNDYLKPFTSVFVGQSGVGKSSLVNALLPGTDTRVGALSQATQKGTHTTTTAQLFHFPRGGHLIDSPGIREFGLWHISDEELLQGFVEYRPFIGECKFRDCRHENEPKCAIKQAEEDGAISPERADSYRYIRQTI